jgi:hypothetical protein
MHNASGCRRALTRGHGGDARESPKRLVREANLLVGLQHAEVGV